MDEWWYCTFICSGGSLVLLTECAGLKAALGGLKRARFSGSKSKGVFSTQRPVAKWLVQKNTKSNWIGRGSIKGLILPLNGPWVGSLGAMSDAKGTLGLLGGCFGGQMTACSYQLLSKKVTGKTPLSNEIRFNHTDD